MNNQDDRINFLNELSMTRERAIYQLGYIHGKYTVQIILLACSSLISAIVCVYMFYIKLIANQNIAAILFGISFVMNIYCFRREIKSYIATKKKVKSIIGN